MTSARPANQVFLSLGSNIEPELHLRQALQELARRGRVGAVSSVWESPALERPDQPAYLNAVVRFETDLSAADLHKKLIPEVEERLGRRRTADKYASRTIDIDLLLFNEEILEIEGHAIPSPEILQRAFVALPLAEIAPAMLQPGEPSTFQEIARRFDPRGLKRRRDIQLTAGALGPQSGTERRAMTPLEIDPSDFDVFRDDLTDRPRQECFGDIECAVRDILTAIGEDPKREGLQRTPERMARMYEELTAGYRVDPDRLVNQAIFEVRYDEMVVVRDIDFYSLCEHHLLPFLGKAHVAYIPDGKVIGLSKIPRIVEMFARRLQLQERMTQQIADFINQALHPCGVAVVVQGLHMCSAMRGVRKANARMVTSAMLGSFKENQATRSEFFDHIGRARVEE